MKRLYVVAALLTYSLVAPQMVHAQWWSNQAQQWNNQSQWNNQWGNQPQWGNQNQAQMGNMSGVSDSLKNIERNADQVAKTIQMKAAYTPNANAPALMMALNAVKDGAKQARRSADSNDSATLMNRLSQLAVMSGNATTVAQRSGMDSFTLNQLQSIQAGVQQAITFANTMPPVVTPYGYPYGQPGNPSGYYPVQMGYAPGVLNVASSGRGQFSLMGQVLMGVKQASISCMDPVSRRATFTISQGNATINLTGTVTAQTPNSATIAVNGSDRGAATGFVTSTIGADGSLMSANGNGTMNGQPFVVSFKGN